MIKELDYDFNADRTYLIIKRVKKTFYGYSFLNYFLSAVMFFILISHFDETWLLLFPAIWLLYFGYKNIQKAKNSILFTFDKQRNKLIEKDKEHSLTDIQAIRLIYKDQGEDSYMDLRLFLKRYTIKISDSDISDYRNHEKIGEVISGFLEIPIKKDELPLFD